MISEEAPRTGGAFQGLAHVLELAWLTVQPREEQPGRLPDVVAVHGQAAPVLGVGDGHAHPLHQRRQQHEGAGKRGHKAIMDQGLRLQDIPGHADKSHLSKETGLEGHGSRKELNSSCSSYVSYSK